MNIGKKITDRRKELGLTQQALAEKLNISFQAVSKWENGGVPDTYLLPVILKVLEVSIDALFDTEKKISEYTQDEMLDILFKFYHFRDIKLCTFYFLF